MVVQHKVIDVDESPELIRLLDQVGESKETTVLRRNGQPIAEIRPLTPRSRGPRRRMDPDEARRVLRETAGGWKSLIDGDKLIEDIYADRDLPGRELPEL